VQGVALALFSIVDETRHNDTDTGDIEVIRHRELERSPNLLVMLSSFGSATGNFRIISRPSPGTEDASNTGTNVCILSLTVSISRSIRTLYGRFPISGERSLSCVSCFVFLNTCPGQASTYVMTTTTGMPQAVLRPRWCIVIWVGGCLVAAQR
jgi:hypothetical protein